MLLYIVNRVCIINRKDYPVSMSPKLKLYEWTVRNKVDKAVYNTVSRIIRDSWIDFGFDLAIVNFSWANNDNLASSAVSCRSFIMKTSQIVEQWDIWLLRELFCVVKLPNKLPKCFHEDWIHKAWVIPGSNSRFKTLSAFCPKLLLRNL